MGQEQSKGTKEESSAPPPQAPSGPVNTGDFQNQTINLSGGLPPPEPDNTQLYAILAACVSILMSLSICTMIGLFLLTRKSAPQMPFPPPYY